MAPGKNDAGICTDDFSTSSKSTYVTSTNVKRLKSKSKWKILAQAIITKNRKTETRISNNDHEKEQNQYLSQILRFPSYNLIKCNVHSKAELPSRVSPSNTCEQARGRDNADEERRTWYHVLAKGYSEINLKVNIYQNKLYWVDPLWIFPL